MPLQQLLVEEEYYLSNDSDVGWKPYFESWMSKYKKKNDEIAINVFTLSLSQYVSDSFLEDLKSKEKIAPVCDMGYIKNYDYHC